MFSKGAIVPRKTPVKGILLLLGTLQYYALHSSVAVTMVASLTLYWMDGTLV